MKQFRRQDDVAEPLARPELVLLEPVLDDPLLPDPLALDDTKLLLLEAPPLGPVF